MLIPLAAPFMHACRKDTIFGKSFDIPFNLLFKSLRFDTIKLGNVTIQHNFLTSDQVNQAGDVFNGNDAVHFASYSRKGIKGVLAKLGLLVLFLFFWHGFHGLHGFFLESVLGVRGFGWRKLGLMIIFWHPG